MNGIHEVRGSIPLSSTIESLPGVREVCKVMRLAGIRWLLFSISAVLLAGTVAGCDNPFDPLQQTDRIQGLTYFDFSASMEHWDSDQEWDGLKVTLSYYNEYGDGLNFHDKPHKVEIEFWTQMEGADPATREDLLISKTVEIVNSDDVTSIPIEFYGDAIGLPSLVSITGCMVVRVFPPQEDPKKELTRIQCGVDFYTPEDVVL